MFARLVLADTFLPYSFHFLTPVACLIMPHLQLMQMSPELLLFSLVLKYPAYEWLSPGKYATLSVLLSIWENK